MNPMALPRIEIEGDDDMERFAGKIGRLRELRAWLAAGHGGCRASGSHQAVEVGS
jgi:hypothetical protein